MEESLCCYCQAHPAEIAAFPSDSSPKVSSICTSCMHRAELQGCTFVPSSCVQFTQTQAELHPEELERRGHGLNTQLSAYQRQVKQEAQIVKSRYKEAFAQLNQTIKAAQDRVMTQIDESEATEVERVNAILGDLREVLDCGSLRTEFAYLAAHFNEYDGSPLPQFLTVSSHLDTYIREITQFPDPIVNQSHLSPPPQHATDHLIEGNRLIMPIDKQNVVIVDFSGPNILHKVYPCSTKVLYRAYGRWCPVSDSVYLYTGGRYRGESLKWCDFIYTNHVNDLHQVERVQGRDMLLPRARHALICTGNKVYVFGGCSDTPKDQRNDREIECLALGSGDWAKAAWEANGAMEEVSDLTATVIGGSIYLAGNSRSVYRYDTVARICEAVRITFLLDLRFNAEAETRRVTDQCCPLPRQSSNTLILAWESQIIVLQHDLVFHFTPGAGEVTMSKKKLDLAKPWCSPFPAVVKGSQSYFMLEPTDEDRMPSNQVWAFDFLTKTVSLAQIHPHS